MYVWCFLQKRNFIYFNEFLLSLTGLHHGNLASKKFAFAVRTIVFSCQVPIPPPQPTQAVTSIVNGL